MSMINLAFLALTLIISNDRNIYVDGTIDINLSELEYLAARLEPRECRRLVASLHYDSYELPKNIIKEAHKVDPSIPCLQHLLDWNSGPEDGKGQTHDLMERRLRQLERSDLADWLGSTVFKELGKDLLRIVDKPFGELAQTDFTTNATESQLTETTTEAIGNQNEKEEKFWILIDLIVIAPFAALIFMIVILIGMVIIDGFARCR